MTTTHPLFRRSWLLLLLLLAIALLSSCGPGVMRIWQMEERLNRAEANLQTQAAQVSQATQAASQALQVAQAAQSTADQALAAVVGTRPITQTPVITTTPLLPGANIDGGVAISYTTAGRHSIDFYTITNMKVYGRGQFATYRQELNPTSRATILFAVAEAPNQPDILTLYTTVAPISPAPARQVWQDYSTSVGKVGVSDDLTRTVTSVTLGGVAFAITHTVPFTVPTGAILNTSLSVLGSKIGDLNLVRRLLLADNSSGTPVYTQIVFEEDGSGAGNDALCAWCSSCGSACRWVCRRLGC